MERYFQEMFTYKFKNSATKRKNPKLFTIPAIRQRQELFMAIDIVSGYIFRRFYRRKK